jgi:hypothetical protein
MLSQKFAFKKSARIISHSNTLSTENSPTQNTIRTSNDSLKNQTFYPSLMSTSGDFRSPHTRTIKVLNKNIFLLQAMDKRSQKAIFLDSPERITYD